MAFKLHFNTWSVDELRIVAGLQTPTYDRSSFVELYCAHMRSAGRQPDSEIISRVWNERYEYGHTHEFLATSGYYLAPKCTPIHESGYALTITNELDLSWLHGDLLWFVGVWLPGGSTEPHTTYIINAPEDQTAYRYRPREQAVLDFFKEEGIAPELSNPSIYTISDADEMQPVLTKLTLMGESSTVIVSITAKSLMAMIPKPIRDVLLGSDDPNTVNWGSFGHFGSTRRFNA